RPVALAAPIERPFERWHLVALLNWREGPALCTLPLEHAVLPPGAEWLVYDFWGQASLGIATHALGRRLPPRSCLLLSLRANLVRRLRPSPAARPPAHPPRRRPAVTTHNRRGPGARVPRPRKARGLAGWRGPGRLRRSRRRGTKGGRPRSGRTPGSAEPGCSRC